MNVDGLKFAFGDIVYRKNSEVAGIFCRVIYDYNWTPMYEVKWPDGSKEECDPNELQLEKPYGMEFSDYHDKE